MLAVQRWASLSGRVSPGVRVELRGEGSMAGNPMRRQGFKTSQEILDPTSARLKEMPTRVIPWHPEFQTVHGREGFSGYGER